MDLAAILMALRWARKPVALATCDAGNTERESAADFYSRMNKSFATDIDLDALIREHRCPHTGAQM